MPAATAAISSRSVHTWSASCCWTPASVEAERLSRLPWIVFEFDDHAFHLVEIARQLLVHPALHRQLLLECADELGLARSLELREALFDLGHWGVLEPVV